MTWRRYPRYEDSGIEWAGTIPENWSTSSVKRHFDIQLGKMLQNNPESEEDRLVLYAKALHVLWGRVETTDLPEMYASLSDIAQYGIQSGDLLVCEGGEGGRAGIVTSSPNPCIIQNALHRVRAKDSADVRFLQYVLNAVSSSGWFDVLCNRATIAHFTREKFAELQIAFPPSARDQRTIAAFLDRETARIDALIAKKERQIALLQEKRAALISRAVTKGLDPGAPMKESGVEWLGEVPTHWVVLPLKRYWTVTDCKHKTVSFIDDGIPVASIREVQGTDVDLSNAKMTTVEEYEELIEDGRKPKKGDIIYSRNATVGSAAFVNTDEMFCMGQDVCLISSNINNQRFLVYQLRSSVIKNQLKSLMVGVTFNRINVAQIKMFLVTCPPRKEQDEISDYCDQVASYSEGLIQKIAESIENLREYRTALISAAVTGKIDVRGG